MLGRGAHLPWLATQAGVDYRGHDHLDRPQRGSTPGGGTGQWRWSRITRPIGWMLLWTLIFCVAWVRREDTVRATAAVAAAAV